MVKMGRFVVVSKAEQIRYNRKDNHGFTLVELLVVISIVALLLSILMPALRVARESGRGVYCAANLRQLGISLTMYLDSNRQVFPLSVGKTDRWFTMDWAKLTGKCPSQRRDLNMSYAYNQTFGYADGKRWNPDRAIIYGDMYRGVKFMKVKTPSEKVIMLESAVAFYEWLEYADYDIGVILSNKQDSGFMLWCDPGARASEAYKNAQLEISQIFNCHPGVGVHNGLVNLLFTDGHVKAIRVKDFKDYRQVNPYWFWPYKKNYDRR
jgi:prepilin-type N-terminal cleavage/methylation domain-containing protein/prepilin-type processing-associated H-X9-DG protein